MGINTGFLALQCDAVLALHCPALPLLWMQVTCPRWHLFTKLVTDPAFPATATVIVTVTAGTP